MPDSVLGLDDIARFNSLSGDPRDTIVETENIAMDFNQILVDFMQGDCSVDFTGRTKMDKFLSALLFLL